MAEHLVERTRALQREAICRHLVAPLSSDLKMPPRLKQNARHQQAIAIGRSLLHLARKDAFFIRQVVLGYSSAANRRMRIVLTRQEDAYFGRAVIELVRLLNIQGLGIRVVGFRVGDQRSDPGYWLKALGLSADTPVHWVNAPNAQSSAGTRHCGIEVVHQKEKGSARTSGTFHHVMVLAAVVEIWRLPVTERRRSVREEDRLLSSVWLPLFDGLSPESFR